MSIPSCVISSIKIDEHVVVRLHHELGLLTEGGHPELAEDVLV